MKIILKNGRVISPKNNFDCICDLKIEDGKITKIEKDINDNADKTIDCTNLIVAPGLIDMHVHFREPGFEYKEDINTGTKAALSGGFTSVAVMPNTNPVCDNEDTLNYINRKIKEADNCNVYPISAITKGLLGEELTDFEKLKSLGTIAFSDDGRPVEKSLTMREALKKAKECNSLIISHCEDMSLAKGGALNEGEIAEELNVKGISNLAEDIMIVREIALAEKEDGHMHVAHVSTQTGVSFIRDAKKRGIKITCETCPHYFSLTEKNVLEKGTNAKMNPPLRTSDDMEEIKKGLKDGTIDCIVTDHAPHSDEEKRREMDKAPNGIVGLETSLGVSITYLVKKGILTINELIEKMSVNPSEILKLEKGVLEVGADADITVIDENYKWTVDSNKFYSKGRNTPYDNEELYGKAKYVIIGGKIKVEDYKLS